MFVCHTCDVKSCVNPEHLFLGTNRDNIVDMYSKGRGGYRGRAGERNAMARLNNAEVRQIKKRLGAGERCAMLARELGMSIQALSDIKLGRKWASIK